jgi:tetratricopeptide (TPR) repeat protein
MRHSFPYILLSILFYSCTSASDYLQEANIAIEKGDYRKAINLLDKALSKKNYLKEAYTEKAHCYTKLNLKDSAIIVYNQLIVFDPTNTLALYNIGLCKYQQEKFDEAISYFDNAMTTEGYNPNDSSRSRFVLEYTQFGKELLSKEDKFEVPFSDLFYMSGLAHYSIGQLKKAYDYFMNCISRKAYLGESYYMVGLCWLDSNKKEKACESFTSSSLYGYSLAKEQLEKTCK